jgi:hypothetical protein
MRLILVNTNSALWLLWPSSNSGTQLIEERLGSERDPAFRSEDREIESSLYPTATPACGSSLVAKARFGEPNPRLTNSS